MDEKILGVGDKVVIISGWEMSRYKNTVGTILEILHNQHSQEDMVEYYVKTFDRMAWYYWRQDFRELNEMEKVLYG